MTKMIISAIIAGGHATVEIKYNNRYAIRSVFCKKGFPWRLVGECLTEIFIKKEPVSSGLKFHNNTDR